MIIPLDKQQAKEMKELRLAEMVTVCTDNNIELEVTQKIIEKLNEVYADMDI